MKRRLLSLCLLAILCLTSHASAFSQTSAPVGKLINDQGECTIIKGRLVETNLLSETPVEHSVTYAYDVLSSDLDHSDTVWGEDDSEYITAYLTLHYSTVRTPTEYRLNEVSGKWIDPDPNDGTKADNTAEVFAVCRGIGTDNFFKNQTITKNVSNHFSFDTGFTKYIHENDMGSIGAKLTLGISQGSQRHWTLELSNYVF